MTIAIDHGRLNGLLSPLLLIKGSRIKTIPRITGLKAIATDSISRGINANNAKIHIKYQSGRGFA